MTSLLLLTILVILSTACSAPYEEELLKNWESAKQTIGIEDVYPMNGSVFPPEIPPPAIVWKDTSRTANQWLVFVKSSTFKLHSPKLNTTSWKPDSAQWELIKNKTQQEKGWIIILGFNAAKPENLLTSAFVEFSTSTDSVLSPIFYRTVPLPFSYAVANTDLISWRLGCVSSSCEPNIALEKLPVCGNCHSFSADGKVLGMDTDYGNDKGSYAIAQSLPHITLSPEKIITWSDFKRDDGENTFGLLSQISPDGRFAASTVKDRSIFVPKDDLYYSQLFFPIKGIIVIYDRHRKEFYNLTGADSIKYVQSNPVWSPDGSYLLFARAEYFKSPEAEKSKKAILPPSVAKDFLEGRRGFQYDIYKVPFNSGQGGIAKPLLGASHNGSSNYFPKVSPDGKWIVFCKADNFMLLQPDSKLYIMPSTGGEARLMSCNTSEMNSWHSWSPNGKWIVFSSKSRGAYTQLYLTHINPDGSDSPAILLENFAKPNFAANIPEFVNIKPGEIEKITEDFLTSDNYALFTGIELLKKNRFSEAVEYLDKAVAVDAKNYSAYFYRGLAHRFLGMIDKSNGDFAYSIKLKPEYAEAYFERGYNYIDLEKYTEAIAEFSKAITCNSEYLLAYYERGIAYYRLGRLNEAIRDNNKVIELDKNAKYAYFQRGLCKIEQNKTKEACADFRTSFELGCPEAADALSEHCR